MTPARDTRSPSARVTGGGGLRPLAGYAVAVTADRRRDELTSMLERRGARVVQALAIRIVPLADDTQLFEATQACVDASPDVVVATTGIGFRGWLSAAEAWGLAERLLDRLRAARLLTRGPKARGAVREAGLDDEWSAPSEESAEILDHLLAGDVAGRRVALQLHGEPLPYFAEALQRAGAEVIEVPVYRWVRPDDVSPLRRLVDQVASRQVDAVTFTSAPAASSLLDLAEEDGVSDLLHAAFRTDVVAACVGPVTAAPLARLGLPTLQPGRARLGALVRELSSTMPAERGRELPVAGHVLEIRGQAAAVDGALCPLPPTSMAVLRALARRPGHVVHRSELLRALPAGATADEHAVEAAVGRLRSALTEGIRACSADNGVGRAGQHLVQTVVKRGYRLAFEPVQHVGGHAHGAETDHASP